jgi:hypothetical protein
MGLKIFINIDTNKIKIDKINTRHKIFNNVFEKLSDNIDFPLINKHYKLNTNQLTTEDVIIKLQNDDAFLSSISLGKGTVYVFSIGLNQEFSNFQNHPLFVPTLYNIILNSRNNHNNIYNIIGITTSIEVKDIEVKDDDVFHIKNLSGTFDFIPQNKIIDNKLNIYIQGQVTEAGNYNIYSDKNLIMALSFNYNRKESDLRFMEKDKLKKSIEDYNLQNISIIEPTKQSLSNIISHIEDGKKLWKLFIILSLICFIIESVLLRFWTKK